jgi:hypothetical protein
MWKLYLFGVLMILWVGLPLAFSIWAVNQPIDERRHRGW